ncbi:multidrug and toxin extrusion protein 2 isoform X5 [Oryctolagus cuniculus]|uniref:multidrug and toxin extrusion protein 2 isoform X5 n=1 Tax=Oryctolagus cuniculus TaxID=9986 RepID=UPI00387A4C79
MPHCTCYHHGGLSCGEAAGWEFLFQVLNFLTYVVGTVFCGHLGKVELASVTLGVAPPCGVVSLQDPTLLAEPASDTHPPTSLGIFSRVPPQFVNVCGVSVGAGLSSACDTLMSQSFGSPNKKHVGVILQRGSLILLLCCLPCWALFLNTQHILLLFRQDPAVSRLTQDYAMIFIPGLPAIFLYSLLAKYLQNQGIVWPQVLSGVVGNCVNGVANYALVSVLNLGVRGSAYANTISQFVQAAFLFLHIVLKKLHLETWEGWSSQCLRDWGPFLSLAIPSMLMMCVEWWAYEIGSFLMGLLGVVDLSGQAIIYEVATVVYMIPMGLGMAVCVRVGTALGAADTLQAKRSAVSGLLCTAGTSLVVGTLLGLLNSQLGYIFTSDEEVIALVNQVLPIYIVFQLVEAVCCVFGGVLRGTGKQAFGAIVNAIMYYIVGLPLGIVLTFVVGMRIMGLWLGMLTCIFLAAVTFVVYAVQLDWKLAAEEFRARPAGTKSNTKPHTFPPAKAKRSSGCAQAQKHAGLQQQQQQQQGAECTAPSPGPDKAVVSSVATGCNPGIALTMYSRPGCHVDFYGRPEAAPAPAAPASRLSVRQLLFRRGAALAASVAVLMAGLLVRVLTTGY